MRTFRSRVIPLALAGLVLVAAACGDDDEESSPADSTDDSSAATEPGGDTRPVIGGQPGSVPAADKCRNGNGRRRRHR